MTDTTSPSPVNQEGINDMNTHECPHCGKSCDCDGEWDGDVCRCLCGCYADQDDDDQLEEEL